LVGKILEDIARFLYLLMQETVTLSDPRGPLQIEYSRAAMEQIRKRARDGLMAAPRVGMGVGGLLLGVRKGPRIRLLDSIDIPCSHAAGPSFDLTADEKRDSREMIAEASAPGVSQKVGVIGWYCSKTRDDASLNQSDRSFYDELFPDPWQVALVVRPNVVDAMRAAFFLRDDKGAVKKAIECDVDEWLPGPLLEAEVPESAPETAHTTIPVQAPEVSSKPARPKPVLAKANEISATTVTPMEIPPRAQAAKLTETRPVAKQAPVRRSASFFRAPGVVASRLRRNKARLGLQIAAILLPVAAAAFMTRGFWMPKPPLNLNFTELNGTLLIHWNPDALRGVEHASMFVNDGGQPTPSLIPLDRLQLSSGLLSYTPKSQRVTAKLNAGETSAIIAWFAPEKPSPEKPAAEKPAPASVGAGDSSPPVGRSSPLNNGETNK
jgi:hypothetical protein